MAKAKFPNMSSLFTRHSNQNRIETNKDDIVKAGSLAKMENNKTKYFVLRRETSRESPACLEYYENINKFNDGYQPRKRYLLKDCLISRNERESYMFALFINNKKCKTLIASSEEDLQDWLSKLHSLKREISGCNPSGNIEYKRIWIVEIINRGLASAQKLAGELRVCLDNWSIWLVIPENDMREIPLNSIKKYGRMNEFFFLELGRQSGIGAGNVWMKTEDPLIAQNMLDIIEDAVTRYKTLPPGTDGQDRFDTGPQRARVNSLSNSPHPSGITSRPRDRACSESCTSVLPRLVPRGSFCRSPNGPFEPLHTPSRETAGSARLLTSSEEDNIGRNYNWKENEYVTMNSKDAESPSADFIASPTAELLPRIDFRSNAYLEMGPAPSVSSTRNASTPIPIVKKSESMPHEISPQSGNSTATSATTSSDRMHDLEGTSGSESLVGSCFGTAELLDRPIRTSSVGSKTEQYKRKNSAPVLAWSSASHSWSGTSGTYFRNVTEFHQRERDTMMIDYSNSNINHEEKEKKGVWAALAGHRLRSNSKNVRSSTTAKICDSKDDTPIVSIDLADKKRSDDYWDIDFQARPTTVGETKGYLPMNAPKSRSGSSAERKMRLECNYLEMAPTADPLSDGYVNMSQSGSSLSVSEQASPTVPTPLSNFNPAHRESTAQDLPPDKISKKNSKKANKSKSMKESSKRSKSDADKFPLSTADVAPKSKFSAFSRIIRKSSTSKSPVNIHVAKPSPPSPVSIIPRRFSKGRADEPETAKILPSSLPPTSGFFKAAAEKQEEKMLFVPCDDSMPSQLRKISELSVDGEVMTRGENRSRHSLTDTPDCENRNYVNFSLNASSPQISQYGRQTCMTDVSPRLSANIPNKNEGYLFMSSTTPTSDPDRAPDIRPRTNSTHSSAERSRSLSGPVAPIDASTTKEKNSCKRPTSATSSPTSRSPPAAHGLGSVSSISSLGDGGLSSASSTCTVVNVGTTRTKNPSGGNTQDNKSSITKRVTEQDADKCRPASLDINYASLDLAKTPEGSPRPSRSSRDPTQDSNYSEIDFVKSEGLRNTSLARNSTCQ